MSYSYTICISVAVLKPKFAWDSIYSHWVNCKQEYLTQKHNQNGHTFIDDFCQGTFYIN